MRNFVEPGPPPRQSPVVRVEPQQLTAPPTVATTSVEVRATYTDRARGFQLATVPVAVAFGGGVLLVAAIGWSVPVFSVAALAVFWCAFLAWWLVGWTVHHVVSPDGIALIQALLGYRYVRHEQRARLARRTEDK